MPTEMSACASCRNPLVLEIEIEDGDAEEDFGAGSHRFETKETVPDDTELPCGCHFHWYSHLGGPYKLQTANSRV